MTKKIIRKLAENIPELFATVYTILIFTYFWIGFWCIPLAFIGAYITTSIVEFLQHELDIKEGRKPRYPRVGGRRRKQTRL